MGSGETFSKIYILPLGKRGKGENFFCVCCFSVAFHSKESLYQRGIFWGGMFCYPPRKNNSVLSSEIHWSSQCASCSKASFQRHFSSHLTFILKEFKSLGFVSLFCGVSSFYHFIVHTERIRRGSGGRVVLVHKAIPAAWAEICTLLDWQGLYPVVLTEYMLIFFLVLTMFTKNTIIKGKNVPVNFTITYFAT